MRVPREDLRIVDVICLSQSADMNQRIILRKLHMSGHATQRHPLRMALGELLRGVSAFDVRGHEYCVLLALVAPTPLAEAPRRGSHEEEVFRPQRHVLFLPSFISEES